MVWKRFKLRGTDHRASPPAGKGASRTNALEPLVPVGSWVAYWLRREGHPAEALGMPMRITACGSPVPVGLAPNTSGGHIRGSGFLDELVDRGVRPPLLAGPRRRRGPDRRGRGGLRLAACGNNILQTDDPRLRCLPIGQPAFRSQTLGSQGLNLLVPFSSVPVQRSR